jgi:hypothetical protein
VCFQFFGQSLLLANALPECDFKYFLKDRACDLSLKARYVTRVHGLNLQVWGGEIDRCYELKSGFSDLRKTKPASPSY